MGDKSFLFSLAVDDLTKEGGALGAYGVTFTNVKGSVKVPEITVIGKGSYSYMLNLVVNCMFHQCLYSHPHNSLHQHAHGHAFTHSLPHITAVYVLMTV